MSPALNSIMRSHNVQFLPIQWRTNFKMDEDESRKRAEEGLDNSFSLADITLKKHIPWVLINCTSSLFIGSKVCRMVRELSNEVLIDIPYFMSHHQTKMIETVCRHYTCLSPVAYLPGGLLPSQSCISTLVCPESVIRKARQGGQYCCLLKEHVLIFYKHIVAHSLGAPLCAHILSSQPTIQPPLEDLHAKVAWNQFLFNVRWVTQLLTGPNLMVDSSLFMLGSPFAVFLHINQVQLIARKASHSAGVGLYIANGGKGTGTNNELTSGWSCKLSWSSCSSDLITRQLDRTGLLGCMAVDSLYNVFQLSDPIAWGSLKSTDLLS